MESLNQSSRFCYHSDDPENGVEFSGKLEIFIHHARNIHNICIYDNQDVYSKFSLTYNPDEMVSTRVVVGGGKNPEFEEKLELNVKQIDAVLKCEIWMLSRARNLLEDQLLGFALVPIPQIVSQGGKISCQNFSLSSTDLFHSPAGTVQLSLSLSTTLSSVSPLNSSADNPFRNFSGNSSISSEVVLLDPNDYSRVEFPDINAATEDQVMISKYFNSNTCSLGSFLHLGSALKAEYDYEMAGNSSEENENENENENSRDESNRNSGILSSTTSISDDRNTADSNSASDQHTPTPTQPETGESQSKVGGDARIGDQREKINEIEDCTGESSGYGNTGRVFTNRVRNAGLEVEQAAMQQQIVDMYMKSMQQFTESLANMKLPMELDSGTDNKTSGNVIRVMERNNDLDVENKKKDGSRVFYGSRAFF